MSNKLVTFVGMPGAGKSTAVDYLISKGVPSAYFGGITMDEVKARGLEVNEVNEKYVREDIRAKEGKGAYAHRIVAQVEKYFNEGQNRVVVDGLYSWTEYKIFKERFGDDAIIIAIAAPRKLRHDRLGNRKDRPLSEEDVTSREYSEIENIEKGGPIANADFTIVNKNDEQAYFAAIDAILNETGYFK